MNRVLLALLVAVVCTAGLWVWVVFMTNPADRPLVAVAGAVTAVLLCGAVAFASHRDQQLNRARARNRSLDGELRFLTDDLLPVAVRKLRDGASPELVLAEVPQPANGAHLQILRMLTWEVSLGQRQRAAAMAACASAAGRVQALATSMLADLREMENRHSEEVLGDLMHLDHTTAQAGRLADSIAVLTGARSGRRWTKPIVMESVLRGAMSRIRAYQRVRVHSASHAAIVGYAAEDVMHALAELMDNATRFSAPSEEVHVYVEDLHTGVVVTIEDGGLGMKPQALTRAERAVSATEPLDLTKLSGTRLGLAVVGCLARKHQLNVFFRPSSRGGTGVVLRIPNQLVTQPRLEPPPSPVPATPAPQPAMAGAGAPGTRMEPVAAPLFTAETSATAEPRHAWPGEDAVGAGAAQAAPFDAAELPDLPKRRRGQTLAAASPPVAPPETPPKPRTDAGSRFSAFRESTAGDNHTDHREPGGETQ